jgi:polyferredoxin
VVARRFRVLRLAIATLVVAVFVMGLSAGAASQGVLGLASVIAGIQLLPSLARMVAGGLAGLAGLGLAWLLVLGFTFLFGRFYCSTLCPLGLFQDGAAWVGRAGRKLLSQSLFGFRQKTSPARTKDLAELLEPTQIQKTGKQLESVRDVGSGEASGVAGTLESTGRISGSCFKTGELEYHQDGVNCEGDRSSGNKNLRVNINKYPPDKSSGIDRSKGFPLTGRSMLAASGILGAIFAPAMLAWLEPYALAARFGSALFGTAWEYVGERAVLFGLFLPVEPLRLDLLWMAAALIPGLLVLGAAVVQPRLFCRWLCPAGALLRLVADRSVFGFRIEGEVCTSCGACQRVCRTGAADSAGRRIESGACVGCFDCMVVCPVGAVRYGRDTGARFTGAQSADNKPVGVQAAGARLAEVRPDGVDGPAVNDGSKILLTVQENSAKKMPGKAREDEAKTTVIKTTTGLSRRNFLLASGTGIAAAALVVPAAGLARRPATAALVTLNGKARPWASPPGSLSVERFSRLCLSCGLCARACPSGVLRQGLATWKFPAVLEPYMDYARGFCQFECVACGAVCPSGAIMLLSVDAKTTAAVARSRLDLPKCIVTEKSTPCGACAEHCPTGALDMARVPAHRHPIPVLDETLCIGCGACETVCPAEPVKALVVSGLAVHETARVLPERPGGAAQAAGRAEGRPGETGQGLEQEPHTGFDDGVDGFPF